MHRTFPGTQVDTMIREDSRTCHQESVRAGSVIGQWRLFLLVLLAVDGAAVAGAFVLAYFLRFEFGIPLLEIPPHSKESYAVVILLAVPSWLGIFAIYRLYDRHLLLGGIHEYTAVANSCTAGIVGVLLAGFLVDSLPLSRGWFVLSWLLAVSMVGSARFLIRRGVYHLRRHGMFTEDALVVGGNEEAVALIEHLCASPTTGLRVVGVIDDALPVGTTLADGVAVVAGLNYLDTGLEASGVRELLVAPTALCRENLLDLYRDFASRRDVCIRLSSGLFEILTTGISVKQAGGLPLISLEKNRITGFDATIKAVLDYFLATVGLILASPLLFVLALVVKLDSDGPVFHRRLVLGRGGRPFYALKFRTMFVNANEILTKDPALREAFERGFKLKHDPRVTRVGQLLRRTSLDEIPQLVNVLMGQMSLVGPRMIAPEEAQKYGKWQLNLLTVKPGITGPWQVNGRNDISYQKRVSLSMHYIRNYTIWLDLQILFQTIPVVLRRDGAY